MSESNPLNDLLNLHDQLLADIDAGREGVAQGAEALKTVILQIGMQKGNHYTHKVDAIRGDATKLAESTALDVLTTAGAIAETAGDAATEAVHGIRVISESARSKVLRELVALYASDDDTEQQEGG